MKIKRLSRDMIRNIAIGETVEYTFPDAYAMECGRVQISKIKSLDGLEFERIKINKDKPLTFSYKRIK